MNTMEHIAEPQMFEWKWSTGETYKKSSRIIKENKPSDNTVIEQCLETNIFLNSIPHKGLQTEQMQISNKRADQNAKLNDRELIVQTTVNPFMNNSNYIEDLQKEHDFLRPKDSNNGSQPVITYSD